MSALEKYEAAKKIREQLAMKYYKLVVENNAIRSRPASEMNANDWKKARDFAPDNAALIQELVANQNELIEIESGPIHASASERVQTLKDRLAAANDEVVKLARQAGFAQSGPDGKETIPVEFIQRHPIHMKAAEELQKAEATVTAIENSIRDRKQNVEAIFGHLDKLKSQMMSQ